MPALRNRVVRLVGLKDLGGLAARQPGKPAEAYRLGDRVGVARLADGRELALKLQYPGIAATVAIDMRLLRGLLRALERPGGGRGAPPDAVLLGRVCPMWWCPRSGPSCDTPAPSARA